MKRKDKTGQRNGRLLVLRRLEDGNYECLCDCGKHTIIDTHHITRTKSCGCLKKIGPNKGRAFKHGETNTRLFRLWSAIKGRCNNPNRDCHKNYFDRGIRLCNEWENFLVFKAWALENGYDPTAKRGECTIDRIDNEKGYSPDNCRFVSLKENIRNRRCTKRFLFHGELITVGEVSERTGTDIELIESRLRIGWDIERAAETPKRVMHYKDGTTNYDKAM